MAMINGEPVVVRSPHYERRLRPVRVSISDDEARQAALNLCSYCGWEKGRHAGACRAPVDG